MKKPILRFPSGRSVDQIKKDAKKIKKSKGITTTEALNLCAIANGINLHWDKAIEQIKNQCAVSPLSNSDFEKFSSVISENDNGIILFAGEIGSGKTKIMQELLSSVISSRNFEKDKVQFDSVSHTGSRLVTYSSPLKHECDIMFMGEIRTKQSLGFLLDKSKESLCFATVTAQDESEAIDSLVRLGMLGFPTGNIKAIVFSSYDQVSRKFDVKVSVDTGQYYMKIKCDDPNKEFLCIGHIR